MTCETIIEKLKSMGSEQRRANGIKLGIPAENSMGVSTGDIRKLAREIKKSNELANELWSTGYHEAKLLAVLLYDSKTLELCDAERLMEDVQSWDLCDHVCKNLIIRLNGYQKLIFAWCGSDQLYVKRAAFTLIASAAIHEKNLTEDAVTGYLERIKADSDDDREHVKKAVSWALREIGKRDFICQEKALLLAHEMKAGGNKAQVWIARDALKELENLVQAEGRGRLISADSQMGKQIQP